MQVEIWSDIACPWCYVGAVRFERAVEQMGVGADVDVVYRAFELDPDVPTGTEAPPLVDYLAAKFGDRGRVAAAHTRIGQAGAELGIDFQWSLMRRANTFDAHRLLAWARRTSGGPAQRTLKKALLRAYFSEGRDISDRGVLAVVAEQADLDRQEAEEVLVTGGEADTVRSEEAAAHAHGISAVPTFVIEGEWMLQGALETDRWVKALTSLQAELASRPS
ncbi:MAG: DsbA family oxidoreductase [Acidimicrobiales bacterium]|nr:DsbA family oxidoreductase [Acidimicrobiales bacterium]